MSCIIVVVYDALIFQTHNLLTSRGLFTRDQVIISTLAILTFLQSLTGVQRIKRTHSASKLVPERGHTREHKKDPTEAIIHIEASFSNVQNYNDKF